MDRGDQQLVDFIATCFNSPLRYVLIAFKWSENEGPDDWQKDVMKDIEKAIVNGADLGTSVRIAVASGHGIGKTALVAWIILWAMSTRPHLRGVVTANTQNQLKDKTWAELSLWHKRAINAHWFEMTATKFYQKQCPDTWFCSAVAWSRERPEAFAGLHAEHVLLIFDEASAIDNVIYETAEGAMTTKGAMWLAFGNPTRNSGKFFEIHNKLRHRWLCKQIDSRTAKMTNKAELSSWVEDYGEDSDFVRIRIKGEFPRAGSKELIGVGLVEAAAIRTIEPDSFSHAPIIIGVDVARFGDDQSVIARRQGLFAYDLKKYRNIDTMRFAGIIAAEIELNCPDAVFIDAGGVGGGVIDRLHQLGYRMVIGVDFGSTPTEKNKYFNKRAEMWCNLKEWLKIGRIPADNELHADLSAPEFFYRGDTGLIQLEKKEEMKRRGLASPDGADALALTFAHPVADRHGRLTELSKVKLR